MLTKEQIEAMKANEKPLALCPEWMQKAFSMDNRLPLKSLTSSGKWAQVPLSSNRCASSTYRLNAYYELPKVEDQQFDQIEIPTEYVGGQLSAAGFLVSYGRLTHGGKWHDIAAYVYHTEAQGRVVSVVPHLFLLNGYVSVNYYEDSVIIDPIAVICRRRKDV